MASRVNETNFTAGQFEELCTMASKILHTPGLSIFMILITIFGAVAILLNILLCCSIWKVTIFHLNLRLLMAHISFCSMWYCASCIVKISYQLSPFFTGDWCSLVVTAYNCKIQEIRRAWPSQALMYACMAVTIERLYSTFRYKKPYTGFPILGITLIPLCYTVPVINSLRTSASTTEYVPVCEVLLSINVKAARSGLALNMTFTTLSLCLVCVLHYWNRSRLSSMLANRALTHTLTARFALDQNIQLTRIIAPSAILEFITFLPSLVFLFCVVVGLQWPYDTKIVLIQSGYLWKISFGIAYPLVAFVRCVHLRRALIKMAPSPVKRFVNDAQWKSTAKVTVITPKGFDLKQTSAHFEMLEQAWNEARR